jgi:glycosyltransferase involved in cell wall biosynthesis
MTTPTIHRRGPAAPPDTEQGMTQIERIVMIAPHFEEYAFLLARALARHAKVLLILDTKQLDDDLADRPRPTAPGVTLRHSDFEGPLELARISLAILRFRPDVLHWQEPSGLIKAVMAAATITLANPFTRTALTIHDAVPHSGRDAAVARRLAPVRRFARARARRLFIHGALCREQYLNEYLPSPHRDDRVRLTEHGTILVGEPVAKAAAPDAGFSALMFGRMEAYKGLDVLLAATRKLAAGGISYRLDLAGSGPELDRLAPEFRTLPGVRVEQGYISSADLIAKMHAADCVVLPYLSATQSGVLAAAMGNGRFVIASRVGGIPDLVEHGKNGLLVEPGDAEGLAEALRSVATDAALRRRLREGARQTAADRRSPTAC